MTRDVLIRLSGLQAMEGDEGTVEVITSGITSGKTISIT